MRGLTCVLQYITWVSNNKQSWTLNVAGLGADSRVEISARPVSQEPMVRVCPSSRNPTLTDRLHST